MRVCRDERLVKSFELNAFRGVPYYIVGSDGSHLSLPSSHRVIYHFGPMGPGVRRNLTVCGEIRYDSLDSSILPPLNTFPVPWIDSFFVFYQREYPQWWTTPRISNMLHPFSKERNRKPGVETRTRSREATVEALPSGWKSVKITPGSRLLGSGILKARISSEEEKERRNAKICLPRASNVSELESRLRDLLPARVLG